MKDQTNHRFWLRTAAGVTLALASATLLTIAFPPYNHGLLIWVGFLPMLVAQYRVLPGKLSSLAPAIAIGGWLGVQLIPMFGGKSFFMAAIPLMTGLLVFFVDKNKHLFHECTGYRWFVIEGAAGWVGLEIIRSFIPALGTWLFVGYPLWNQPWLLQPLSIFGIYGLDLLIMLGNYVLAQGLFILLDKKWKWDDAPSLGPRPAHGWLLIFAILLSAWTGFSLYLFTRPLSPAIQTIRVAAIQPNMPRAAHRDMTTPPEQRLAILAAQTRAAAAQGARIVVWPEMSLGFDPQVEHTRELQSLAAETQSYIVIGYVVADTANFRNEATILAPSGEFLGVYGKTHPAVFSGEPATISRGTYPAYDTPIGRMAAMICFDADFTDVSRQYGEQGAQLVADPSLFSPGIAQMPYTQIVFRAIENRTAIIMADAAYNSAIVDPYGRIVSLAITPKGDQTSLIGNVRLGIGETSYSQSGDWLGWLSLAGMVFFAAYMPVFIKKGKDYESILT